MLPLSDLDFVDSIIELGITGKVIYFVNFETERVKMTSRGHRFAAISTLPDFVDSVG